MVSVEKGIWFVYDGECPLCASAAAATRLKKQFGKLHLLDARQATNHPLTQAISIRGLDLDEGMVIFDGRRFYHGAEALHFMAVHGEPQGFHNRVFQITGGRLAVARLLYPCMRSIRNMLLRLRGVKKINNFK